MWTPQAPRRDDSGRESQPTAPTALPASAPRTEERRTIAWIGRSVTFKGELSSAEDMTIAGHVEGSIDARNHSVVIAPEADIRADIVARRLTIQGKVTGQITASDTVALGETASVEGDIRSPKFGMLEGARMRGRIHTAETARQAAPAAGDMAPADRVARGPS